MHIAEGVLPAKILISGGVLSACFTAYGLKKLKYKDIPRVALLSGLFFIGSFIHVPLGPTSVHLILNSIVGIFAGWASFPAILIALFLQAIMFGFGGITTLGVNTFNMAFPAILAFFFFNYFIKKNYNKKFIFYFSIFLTGAGSVFFSALLLSLSLYLAGQKFFEVAKIAFVAHIPVMVIEGLIVMFMIAYIKKVYPEILEL